MPARRVGVYSIGYKILRRGRTFRRAPAENDSRIAKLFDFPLQNFRANPTAPPTEQPSALAAPVAVRRRLVRDSLGRPVLQSSPSASLPVGH